MPPDNKPETEQRTDRARTHASQIGTAETLRVAQLRRAIAACLPLSLTESTSESSLPSESASVSSLSSGGDHGDHSGGHRNDGLHGLHRQNLLHGDDGSHEAALAAEAAAVAAVTETVTAAVRTRSDDGQKEGQTSPEEKRTSHDERVKHWRETSKEGRRGEGGHERESPVRFQRGVAAVRSLRC